MPSSEGSASTPLLAAPSAAELTLLLKRWSAGDSGYRCVARGSDPCQGVDSYGLCDGCGKPIPLLRLRVLLATVAGRFHLHDHPRSAEAEAKATQMVSDAIAKGDVNAINYFVATKYVEALHSIGIAPNQKVIFMPMETAGVLGSLGGIGELAKEAFSKRGA